jgi:hypothetical protein
MKTYTWEPGSNPELDKIFNKVRLERYNDHSHRYWKNYGEDSFEHAVALTICFDDTGVPEMCSSIAQRDCWPSTAYRILNRLWKHSNKILYPRVMSPSFAETAKSQIEWLKEYTDCELYFISRQTDNWEDWVIKNFADVYGINFKKDNYKYLTCPDECDDTCWQRIIYNGNDQLLSTWKRRT